MTTGTGKWVVHTSSKLPFLLELHSRHEKLSKRALLIELKRSRLSHVSVRLTFHSRRRLLARLPLRSRQIKREEPLPCFTPIVPDPRDTHFPRANGSTGIKLYITPDLRSCLCDGKSCRTSTDTSTAVLTTAIILWLLLLLQ